MERVLWTTAGLVVLIMVGGAWAGVPTAREHAHAWRSAVCGAAEAEAVGALAEYYDSVVPVATVEVGGAVVDCVAFEDQPALLGRPAGDVAAARAAWERVGRGGGGARASVCPGESVGVTRFRIRGAERPVRGAVAKRCLPQAKQRVAATLPQGYSYVLPTPPFAAASTATDVWSAHSVGVGVPLATCLANDECHSVNQQWWLGRSDDHAELSLEAGWVSSNYFSPKVTTSFFVYSTNDTYAGDKADLYNLAGGFVAYPHAPLTPGVPLTDFQWIISYRKDDAAAAFVHYAMPFNSTGSSSFSASGTWIPIGHYPYSRFPNGRAFSEFSCGAEIFHTTATKAITASGRILGWGTSAGTLPIDNKFVPDPAGTGFSAAFAPVSWAPANPYSNAYAVHFSGSPTVTQP